MDGMVLGMGLRRAPSAGPAVPEQTLFDHATKTYVGANEPGTAVSLGVVFTATASGEVRSVQFWKTAADAATARSAAVYSSVGALIASGSSVGEAAGPGWRTVVLDTPVPITALTLYVAAVHFPLGNYPALAGEFSSPIVRGDVVGESEVGAGGAQGRWKYGAALAYPDGDGGGSGYGIDFGFFAS